jgi:hypothetical protein
MGNGNSVSTIETLKQMYLPDFMTLHEDGDYSGDSAVFCFILMNP